MATKVVDTAPKVAETSPAKIDTGLVKEESPADTPTKVATEQPAQQEGQEEDDLGDAHVEEDCGLSGIASLDRFASFIFVDPDPTGFHTSSDASDLASPISVGDEGALLRVCGLKELDGKTSGSRSGLRRIVVRNHRDKTW